MSEVYHNVDSVTFGGLIAKAKSVSVDEQTTYLISQSDGARVGKKVGIMATVYSVNVTLESDGSGLAQTPAFAGGNFEFTEQADDNPETLKTHTATNMCVMTQGISTSQSDPNEKTLSFESKGGDSVWSTV